MKALMICLMAGVLTAVSSSQALAASVIRPQKPIDLTCVTEFPTTSFVVETQGDHIGVQVIHHNGTRYMPIWNGIATPEDLKGIGETSEVLQKLGDHLKLQWDASACKVENDLMFQCVGKAQTIEVNGIKVEPWSLSVSEVTENAMSGAYFRRNLLLNMTIEDKTYRISMDYGPQDCGRSDSFEAHPRVQQIKKLMRQL